MKWQEKCATSFLIVLHIHTQGLTPSSISPPLHLLIHPFAGLPSRQHLEPYRRPQRRAAGAGVQLRQVWMDAPLDLMYELTTSTTCLISPHFSVSSFFSRALFNADRLTLGMHMACHLAGGVKPEEWNFLLGT